jgi:hypothetical protein
MGGSTPGFTMPRTARSKKQTCDLIIHTQLKSPNENVVININTGDVLPIIVLASDECLALHNGEVAGKIFCMELKELLDCIAAGNIYEAKVRSLNGIRCTITISQT